MKTLPEIFSKYTTQLWYIFIVPILFFIIMAVYRPFGNPQTLDMGRNLFFFNITIMMCIILVYVAITRHIFYFLRKYLCKQWWQIILWSATEILGTTFFIALYLTLMDQNEISYFIYLAISLQYTFLILIVPYFGISTILTIYSLKKMPLREQDTVRFSDSNGQTKIVLIKEAILYIKADENYIKIHYLDAEKKIKTYSMRSSMTAISPIMDKFNMFRCHRSYYINPSHIVALRKESSDIYSALMDVPDTVIPVSKKQYPALSEKL